MDCLPENVNTNDLNYNSPQPKKNKVFKKKPNESKDIRGLLRSTRGSKFYFYKY